MLGIRFIPAQCVDVVLLQLDQDVAESTVEEIHHVARHHVGHLGDVDLPCCQNPCPPCRQQMPLRAAIEHVAEGICAVEAVEHSHGSTAMAGRTATSWTST